MTTRSTRTADPPVADIPAPRRAARTVALDFVGVLAALAVFGTLAVGIRDQEWSALDAFVTPFLHDRASSALDAIMNAATFVGSDIVILGVTLAALATLILRGRAREAAYLTVAVAGSVALNALMKVFFQRPRPILPWAHVLPDYSFPSGHSMNSFVLYVGLALLAWALFGRRVGIPAILSAVALVVLIGMSRIYLGYHYFTDVIGGFTAGLTWLLLVGTALRAGPLLTRWRQGGSAPPRRGAG